MSKKQGPRCGASTLNFWIECALMALLGLEAIFGFRVGSTCTANNVSLRMKRRNLIRHYLSRRYTSEPVVLFLRSTFVILKSVHKATFDQSPSGIAFRAAYT